MNTLNTDTEIKQYTTVYHIEYGKGYVVSLTPKMKDMLCMCYFPKAKQSDWCLRSALSTGTDTYMSLNPMSEKDPKNELSDPLQDALNNLFGGRQ